MPRYAAFLRGINISGRVVKMDRLRGLFESLDFAHVETFIASGNVLFSSRSKAGGAMERRIEHGLREALGYQVSTFIRLDSDLAAIAAREPFAAPLVAGAGANYIAFLREAPDAAAKKRVMLLRSQHDSFHFQDRELHVVSRLRYSESAFTFGALEKALGASATVRGINTVRKMAAKFVTAPVASTRRAK